MNNRRIADLTLRLSQALDQNYDVVNMDIVISVISDLEGTAITKEQLEATRLARYINELRRRTKSGHLARRAKSLLKKWREMVGIQTQQIGSSTFSGNNVENAFGHNLQHSDHRASSVSPSVIGIGEDSNKHVISREFLSSTLSNPSLMDSLPKNGNIVSQNTPNTDTSFSKPLSGFKKSTSKVVDGGKQPISFANVLLNIDGDSKSCSSKLFKNIESYITQEKSETNNDSGSIVPIVIQDSNSGSNITPSKLDKVSTPDFSFKTKKSKKEKKHKERKNEGRNSIPSADDSYLSHKRYIKPNVEKITYISDDNSQSFCPLSHISEILSLSNSSMSSMFPNNMKKKSEKKVSVTGKTADLTFTGKINTKGSKNTTCNSDSIFELEDNSNTITPLKSSTIIAPYDVIDKLNENSSNSLPSKFVCESLKSEHRINKSKDDILENVEVMANTTDLQHKTFKTYTSLFAPIHQGLDATESNASVISEGNVPKKRGRKKGSKGVDSIIAKESNLSSQILISTLVSGTKKVKTTKELYAEMQNRKFVSRNSTPPSTDINWMIQQQCSSRPESSCSEPSINSILTPDACSTNATISTLTRSTPEKYLHNSMHPDEPESDSETIVSEPSQDSTATQHAKKLKVFENNKKNVEEYKSKAIESSTATIVKSENIEKQLQDLLNQLPSATKFNKIEEESSTYLIPCTCDIVELDPKHCIDQIEISENKEILTSTKNIFKDELPQYNTQSKNDNIGIAKEEKFSISSERIIKKSIFDLDFNEDEDPLKSFNLKYKNSEDENDQNRDSESFPLKTETQQYMKTQSMQIEFSSKPEFDQPIFATETAFITNLPIYRIEEDPNCIAKQRFNIQTQQVTKFHVNALHNCFVPNVNGNWDNSDTSLKTISKESSDTIPSVISELKVVPKFGSLVKSRIKKDLSHIKFTKNVRIKNQIFIETPFLGVARYFHRGTNISEKNFDIKIGDTSSSSTLQNSSIKNNNLCDFSASCIKSFEETVEVSTEKSFDNVKSILESSTKESPIRVSLNNSKPEFSQKRDEIIFKKQEDNSCKNSKLRYQRMLLHEKKSLQFNKRKRKRKKEIIQSSDESENETRSLQPKKRHTRSLKIAINGDVSTQRQFSDSSSCSMFGGDYEQEGRSDSEHETTTKAISSNAKCKKNKDLKRNVFTKEKKMKFKEYDDDDVEYGHEVVTHDISSVPSTKSNRIILTIKKASSKNNSRSYSSALSPAVSPTVTYDLAQSYTNNIKNSLKNNNENEISMAHCLNKKEHSIVDGTTPTLFHSYQKDDNSIGTPNASLLTPLLKETVKNRVILSTDLLYFDKDRTRRKKSRLVTKRSILRLHEQLFFPDEMSISNNLGMVDNIINITSCSSESEDVEFQTLNENEPKVIYPEEIENQGFPTKAYLIKSPRYDIHNNLNLSTKSEFNLTQDQLEVAVQGKDCNNFKLDCSETEKFDDHELPLQNNGLLMSFNNIYSTTNIKKRRCTYELGKMDEINENDEMRHVENTEVSEQIEIIKCDEYNKICNNNNNNLTNYDCNETLKNEDHSCKYNQKLSSSGSSNPNTIFNDENLKCVNDIERAPYKEYRTGLRAVDEDVDDDDGNNCAHIQQFKEWHEVLQLRSYNDELLTILPYVLIE